MVLPQSAAAIRRHVSRRVRVMVPGMAYKVKVKGRKKNMLIFCPGLAQRYAAVVFPSL